MSTVPTTHGVYILIFHLPKATKITFNRKSSQHLFPSGWYLYVGSACGVGGLRARLARHKRNLADGKRMHWNVDFFRERAMLCEIWYGETNDSGFEHLWAQKIAGLIGATVPVPKFGANDCEAGCPSHFFHLAYRPLTEVFRSILDSTVVKPTVSVEFLAEPRITKSSCGLESEYFRGNRFIELRNSAIRVSNSTVCEWTSLSKGRPARALAEDIARQISVSFAMLRHAVEFAIAVNVLIRNCGEPAWSVLFDPNRPQTQQAILSLSRTSDARQRYRINGVSDGRFLSVAPQSDDTVFDTVRFAEVPSRLSRARGSLEKLLSQVSILHADSIMKEVKQLSRLCRFSAKRLDDCLMNRVALTSPVSRGLCKETVMSKVRSEAVKGRDVGMARLALRLTVKNLWDFEEMKRRGMVPTAQQLVVTRSEIKRIRQIARLIERRDFALQTKSKRDLVVELHAGDLG